MAVRPCSMGGCMKKFRMFGAVLAVVAVSGFAGATGWGELNSSGTPWEQVKPPAANPDGGVVLDPGSSTCNRSQWTEERTVDWSTTDTFVAATACAYIGSKVTRAVQAARTIITTTTKSGDFGTAVGVGAAVSCTTVIEKYVTGLDTRTCTRTWNNYMKMCETVCGAWR